MAELYTVTSRVPGCIRHDVEAVFSTWSDARHFSRLLARLGRETEILQHSLDEKKNFTLRLCWTACLQKTDVPPYFPTVSESTVLADRDAIQEAWCVSDEFKGACAGIAAISFLSAAHAKEVVVKRLREYREEKEKRYVSTQA